MKSKACISVKHILFTPNEAILLIVTTDTYDMYSLVISQIKEHYFRHDIFDLVSYDESFFLDMVFNEIPVSSLYYFRETGWLESYIFEIIEAKTKPVFFDFFKPNDRELEIREEFLKSQDYHQFEKEASSNFDRLFAAYTKALS